MIFRQTPQALGYVLLASQQRDRGVYHGLVLASSVMASRSMN